MKGPAYTSLNLAALHDEILGNLQQDLTQKRFLHVMGVLQCSLSLAAVHGYPTDKVVLAALLHDCAKNYDRQELEQLLEDGQVELTDEDRQFPSMWHGPAGAWIAKSRYGVTDGEILDAIANHTVGHANPSPTLMLLMAADSCEPTRIYPGVNDLRHLIRKDLKSGLLEVLNRKVQDVVDKGKTTHTRIYETIKSLES